MATQTFTAVDLSKLPPPKMVEELDYETILAEWIISMKLVMPDYVARESDPAAKVMQIGAYREMLLRQRINDAAYAVMPAYASGSDLDQIGARAGVARFLLDPGDPANGIAPIYESDEDFRRRVVLAPEGYSVAGPEGAYIFHALSADSRVLDASAVSDVPGEVIVTILSRDGDGTAPADLIITVNEYLSAETRRPLTDYVIVRSANIHDFAVSAEITTFSGPDASVVLAEARRRLDDYLASSHRLGRDITISGLHAALHAEGVQNVRLISPPADIIIDRQSAAHCTGVSITHRGIGE